MKEDLKNNFNIVTAFLVVIEIVFLIFSIIVLNNLLKGESEIAKVDVDNLFENIEGLSASSGEIITSELFDAISFNSGDASSIPSSGAKVRDNTLINNYYEKMNLHYVNFIVDIPSLEQSYQVFYEWSDDNNNHYMIADNSTMVMCIADNNKVVYKDFKCKDRSNNLGRYLIIDQFNIILKSFINDPYLGGYNVLSKKDGVTNKKYLKINVFSCGNNELIENAKKEINEYFNTLGYSLDEFDYETFGYCEED